MIGDFIVMYFDSSTTGTSTTGQLEEQLLVDWLGICCT
jgi:hypothetical protein